MTEMNEYQIKNGLRKHWSWLKNTSAEEVAKFVIAHGRRKGTDDKPWLDRIVPAGLKSRGKGNPHMLGAEDFV